MSVYRKYKPGAGSAKSAIPPATLATTATKLDAAAESVATVATVAGRSSVVPLFDDERAEREAIAEFDSGIPKNWAIVYGLLITSQCPAWMKPEQWKRHHDAAGKLLANWSAQMQRLGWSPAEVLGVDPRWPGKSWEPCLLSALVGVTVGAVSENRIVIVFPESSGGGSRTLERVSGKWVYA